MLTPKQAEQAREMLNQIEWDENMPCDHWAWHDLGCIECTAGVVPNHLNTGLCFRHWLEREIRDANAGESK